MNLGGIRIQTIFDGIEFRERIGELPLLTVRIKAQFGGHPIRDSFLVVTRISVNVHLLYVKDRSMSKRIGFLGNFELSEGLRIQNRGSTNCDFSFPINHIKLEKMYDILNNGGHIGFNFDTTVSGQICRPDANQTVVLTTLQYKDNVFEITSNGLSNVILLENTEFQQIVGRINYSKILRIEIPLDANSALATNLQKATKLMDSAANHLERNNNEAAMIEIRKSLTNHLISEFSKGPQRKRVLGTSIKSDFMAGSPSTSKSVYKEVVKQLEQSLHSALRITNLFLHDDNANFKMIPARSDVEFVYFSVALVIVRLVRGSKK